MMDSFNSLSEDEKIAVVGTAVIITSIVLFISFIAWVVLTDEYTVKEHSKCIKYEHVTNGHVVTSKCVEYNTSYICRIVNGQTLANCKDAKRCEDVCNKAREEN